MRVLVTIFCLFLVATAAGCDMRSETAKREMDKFNGDPTPTITPAPTEPPIDPADVVQADVNTEGGTLSVNGQDQKKSLICKKLDRVTVNGDRCVVTIQGPCRQIVMNGDDNQITGDAAIEIVFNGNGNSVKYSRYVNGKRPIILGDAAGNTFEKVAAAKVTK